MCIGSFGLSMSMIQEGVQSDLHSTEKCGRSQATRARFGSVWFYVMQCVVLDLPLHLG